MGQQGEDSIGASIALNLSICSERPYIWRSHNGDTSPSKINNEGYINKETCMDSHYRQRSEVMEKRHFESLGQWDWEALQNLAARKSPDGHSWLRYAGAMICGFQLP